ncbi:MAG: hypothetical protein KGQ41_08150 [Alphaproteobacteria bacterium]|nr:hypothetical protein [Alphaproteobacteria bacterium]
MSPRDSVYVGMGFSEFMQKREEQLAVEAFNSVSENQPAPVYTAPPLFPADAKQLVIWGLNDVLVSLSDKIEGAYKTRTVEVLSELLGREIPAEEEAAIHDLVHQSYVQHKLPSRLVAAQYNVNEPMLMVATLSKVSQKDLILNAAKYRAADQGILNGFEASKDAGIVHAVVTNSTSGFARDCLHLAALDLHIRSAFGVDIYGGPDGQVRRKCEEGVAILEGILEDVPAERRKDILVVDHNREFLAAAQKLGLKTHYLDVEASVDQSRGYAVANAVMDVFSNVLKLGEIESRRPSMHIYAGVSPK